MQSGQEGGTFHDPAWSSPCDAQIAQKLVPRIRKAPTAHSDRVHQLSRENMAV